MRRSNVEAVVDDDDEGGESGRSSRERVNLLVNGGLARVRVCV